MSEEAPTAPTAPAAPATNGHAPGAFVAPAVAPSAPAPSAARPPSERRRFARSLLAAFVAYGIAAGVALFARSLLTARGVGPDLTDNVAIGVGIALALGAGFVVSLVAGEVSILPIAIASHFLGAAVFASLWRHPPMSFSYVYMLAPPQELALYGEGSALAALVVGLVGGTVAQLFGAGGALDTRLAFEYGIARTHLRLTRRTMGMLALLAFVPPALLILEGQLNRPLSPPGTANAVASSPLWYAQLLWAVLGLVAVTVAARRASGGEALVGHAAFQNALLVAAASLFARLQTFPAEVHGRVFPLVALLALAALFGYALRVPLHPVHPERSRGTRALRVSELALAAFALLAWASPQVVKLPESIVAPARVGAYWAAVAACVAVYEVARFYLWRIERTAHKRPPTVVMTAISIAGVAVGVWALTVVLSVMSGFELDLKRKILGTNAHAVVLKYAGDFSEWPALMDKVRKVPGVAGETPFTMNEVMLSTEGGTAGALIKGIDIKTVGEVTDLPKNIDQGTLDSLEHCNAIEPETADAPRKPEQDLEKEEFLLETKDFSARRRREAEREGTALPPPVNLPCIVIGKEMSRTLKVWVGDTLNVLTAVSPDIGPTGPVPRNRAFKVGAIFYSGMYEYDSKFVYISIPEAQSFFRMGKSVTGLELKVTDIDAARPISRRVLAALDGFPYRTKDWGEMNRNLFSALKLEKLTMAIILTFIVLVACFNIVSTLIMLVIEKRKEIAILKSMGSRDSTIMKIFVLEGLIIGAVGATIGLLLGYGSCNFIERYGIHLDPEVYYISNLPVRVDGWQFALVALIAVVLSYLATIYPALKASRLPPVEGLTNE